MGVADQQPRPCPEDHTAHRQLVQLRDAVRDHQRVVIGQRDDAGAELDPARTLRRRRDHDLRRGADLIATGMMLTVPIFFEAELVGPFGQLQIALEAQRRTFIQRMERRHKDADTEWTVAQLTLAARGPRPRCCERTSV